MCAMTALYKRGPGRQCGICNVLVTELQPIRLDFHGYHRSFLPAYNRNSLEDMCPCFKEFWNSIETPNTSETF